MAGPRAFTDNFVPDFGLPWPRYELGNYDQWSDADIQKLLQTKMLMEANAQEDPIAFGWTLESWREVWEEWQKYNVHCICGGNRSSKSVSIARLCMWAALTIPEAQIRCFQVNDSKSISEQQAYIWEALPTRFKTAPKKRGITHSLTFTQMNGFTNGKLILPPQPNFRRGSEIIFGTYASYRNDPQVVEGWWAHLIWCDEEVPQKMFERLLTRLFDAHGRMILTFTTIQGWSPLISDILGRTRTIRKRYSPLLKREIPVAQESLSRGSTRIYYYWTQDNPFIPNTSLDMLKGRPAEEILAIAHGIPTKPAMSKFPRFDETVHVMKHEELPWIKRGKDEPQPELTRYLVIDPSGSKPWFMTWFAVDALERIFIYREWPDIAHGPWGEVGERVEGKVGPAQRPNGFGINDYVEIIKQAEAENEETLFERYMDPRLGAATTQAKEGATSIMSELEDAGMSFIPAPGLHVDHGLQLINDALAWDSTKPLSILNSPKLVISDRCEQTIEALKNYTGAGGQGEVWKDPIDTIRYMMEAGANHVTKSDLSNDAKTFSY